MPRTATIDINRLNEAIARNMPDFAAKQAAKAEKQLHPEAARALAVGFAGIPGTGFIDDAQANFCSAWPKARTFINTALRVAGWVPGAKDYLPLVKSVLAAVNDEIYPAVCQQANKQ